MDALSITPIRGLPEIRAGDDLSFMIERHGPAESSLAADALLVVAQKIVSKAEGRLVALRDVEPGARALELAAQTDKDPRLVELILAESRCVLRMRPGLLIVEHRTGHILANAGIDASNIEQDVDNPRVLLWPKDPDDSACRLSRALGTLMRRPVPVIINDSVGRPWRQGTVGIAIGCYGLDPLWNQVGDRDRHGNRLRVTEPATADAIAAAAALVQGEAAEGLPAVWVQGCRYLRCESTTSTRLQRERTRDMFR